jgi:DNA-binding MarR family transcriptional regulator
MTATRKKSAPTPADAPLLALEEFFPYRLAMLSNRVSGAIASTYATRFGLSIPEWRVMAILGRHPDLSAREVVERTMMDKVTVSRAVARLLAKKRLARAVDGLDRRRSVLRLSSAGERVYREIVPFALAKERVLLDALTPSERRALDRLLATLSRAAERL